MTLVNRNGAKRRTDWQSPHRASSCPNATGDTETHVFAASAAHGSGRATLEHSREEEDKKSGGLPSAAQDGSRERTQTPKQLLGGSSPDGL